MFSIVPYPGCKISDAIFSRLFSLKIRDGKSKTPLYIAEHGSDFGKRCGNPKMDAFAGGRHIYTIADTRVPTLLISVEVHHEYVQWL